MRHFSRRQFLKSAGAAAGAVSIIPASALGRAGRPAPSDRITLAFIGTGNMAMNHVLAYLKDERVQIVAVCDVNRGSGGYWNGGLAGREPARQLVDFHYGREIRSGEFKACAPYTDFRDVIRRDDVDAVIIATPDHWHAIPAVQAARAGKDVYCEKPLSLTVAEGRAMSDAASENNIVFQVGSQQRSDARFHHAAELVRNGRIGRVHTARVGLPGGRPDLGMTGHRKAPEPVPEGFDYDLWLGPAPEAPYAPARTHVNFRWIFDYSGGMVTDWGGHHPDIAQWGLDTVETGPVAIRNARGVFPEDELWNTATAFHFEAEYDNGVVMIVSNEERMGVTFEGDDGWIWVTRGAHEVSDEEIWASDIGENEIRLHRSDNHHDDFINSILNRTQPVAPAEHGHRSITICHLGNIAMRLGRDLRWDPVAERVIGDDSANDMLSRPMREPWSLT